MQDDEIESLFQEMDYVAKEGREQELQQLLSPLPVSVIYASFARRPPISYYCFATSKPRNAFSAPLSTASTSSTMAHWSGSTIMYTQSTANSYTKDTRK